jgi:hypothetical protein
MRFSALCDSCGPPHGTRRWRRPHSRILESIAAVNALPPGYLKALRRASRLIAAMSLAMIFVDSLAQPALYDGADGATCDYFNRGAQIRWRYRLGDWKDAQGTERGEVPFAEASVGPTDRGRVVTWDVTALVQGWLMGKYLNSGLLAAAAKGRRAGVAVFHSREAAGVDSHPRLILVLPDGTTQHLSPSADTTLDCSTVYSLGSKDTISASADRRLLMQFDLTKLEGVRVSKATLELVTTDKQYGDTVIDLFRVAPHLSTESTDEKPQLGLAARYPHDREIQRDPDVIMATGFESALWQKDWNFGEIRGSFERIDGSRAFGFEPFDGHALQVMIPIGKNLGLDMRYRFLDKVGYEPEEIYFRYYLRLASDWNPTTDGGKLPGITSTYGVVGWGGRKADGMTGWSMRGNFYRLPDRGNPYHSVTPIGTYAYHADMEDFYGDGWAWSESGRALLERNRWYCIEQYVKVNQPGRKDAVVRAWVDGRQVLEHTGFRVRDVPSIKIEQIWMNVWYGGTAPSPQDQHLFIDNIVIARRYIGPMKE